MTRRIIDGFKKSLFTAAKYALAIGVLSYVLYANWAPAGSHGLGDVWQRHVVELQPIDGKFLLLAVVLDTVGMTSTLVRWYLLVRAQNLPFTLFQAIRIGTLSFLCNAFLPGSVGGDVIKAAALARGQDRRTVAVATVVMDRTLSIWALVLLVAVVGSIAWCFDLLDESALGASETIILTADILIGISLVLWLITGIWSQRHTEQLSSKLERIPKIGASLAELWQAAWLYRNRPGAIAGAIALSTLSNVCDILVFYSYVRTLWDGDPANPLPALTEHALLVPVGLVISGVPLFPGGTGIGEAGFGGLYRLFGSASANGVLGSLLFRISSWIIGIVGYLLCLWNDRNTPVLQRESSVLTPTDDAVK